MKNINKPSRIGVYMICLQIFCLTIPNTLWAQNQKEKISMTLKNATIQDLVKQIESKTQYTVVYRDAIVSNEKDITARFDNESLDEILNAVLEKKGIRAVFNNKTITFIKKEGSVPNSQQTKTISGIVTDENGETLPGVNVFVKGKDIGNITDLDGKYIITVSDQNDVLVFTYIGMQKQEITVGKNQTINATLREESIHLDEVVALGYTTSKRRDMIGSVAKMSDTEIASPAYSNFTSAMQGKASGVFVTGNTIRIRGLNSISLSTEPLWIIDGVPGNGSNLNPNDIESISILKDASATALYGSSGANGVIAVTTKSMKGQTSQLNVEVDYGISELMNTDWETLNTRDFLDLHDISKQNASKYEGSTYAPYDPNKAFDWNPAIKARMTRDEALNYSHRGIKDATRQANFYQVHMNASKGFDRGSALFTVTYRSDEDVYKGGENSKLISRAAFNYSPIQYVDVSITSINNYNNAVYSAAKDMMIRRTPYMPIYDENDPTGYWGPGENPVMEGDRKYRYNYGETFSSNNYIKINIELPFVKGLSIAGTGSANFSTNRGQDWYSKELMDFGNQEVSKANENSTFGRSYLYRGEINYNRTFGDHTVTLLALAEAKKSYGNRLSAEGYNLNGSYPILGTPGNMNSMSSTISEGGSIAYIGRATYKYKERYLLEANIRRDGLSTLSVNNRWATFPSVGAGWVLSEEAFFNLPVVNLIKIRGSIGKTGNAAVPSFTYIPQFGINSPNGNSYAEYMFTNIKSIPADVKWETSDNYDIGIDFGILGNRINGSFAYFEKRTSGLLLQVPLPPSAGIEFEGLRTTNSVWANVGNMKNNGFEMNINANAINSGGFSWDISFNHTITKNKVLGLDPSVDQTGSGIYGAESYTLTKKGESIATYYLPDFAGIDPQKGIPLIWERDAEIYEATGKTVRTGNKIPGTLSNSGNNQFLLSGKSVLPTFYGGLRNTFRYKGFDLTAMITYSGGYYFMDQLDKLLTDVRYGQFALLSTLQQDSWQKPGDNAKYPEMIYNGGFYYDDKGNPATTRSEPMKMNTQFLKKGDNVQLKELTLGYTIPKNLTKKIAMDVVRLHFNINNVFYLTKAGRLGNPEVILNSNNIDGYTRYERFLTRTYSFGLSVKF